MNEKPVGKIPEQVIAECASADNVVLFTHSHPDGDALGSLFALGDILESLGKRVFRFLEEPVSHLYDFLPGCQKVGTELEELRRFIDGCGGELLGIALDCGDAERLGKWKEPCLLITPFVVIDHHQSHRDFGTCRWVEPTRSSTGEMVYELALGLGAEVSYTAAYCLYVAICTDTGSFRYECTGPRTMAIAGKLLERGVMPAEVGGHLYDNFTRERLKLMEMVLSTVLLVEDNRLAFMHVSDEMLQKSGACLQDVEGFIDFPRSLRSVKVAVLIKEANNGVLAISLRAKGECDVSEVAKRFDGGGHRNAAGFRCYGKSIDEIRTELQQAIAIELERYIASAETAGCHQ